MAQVPGVDAGIAAGVDELHALAAPALLAQFGELPQGAGRGRGGAEIIRQAADAMRDEQFFEGDAGGA